MKPLAALAILLTVDACTTTKETWTGPSASIEKAIAAARSCGVRGLRPVRRPPAVCESCAEPPQWIELTPSAGARERTARACLNAWWKREGPADLSYVVMAHD